MSIPNYNLFFSIIVPVYKVEDYLRECVESVLQQTFQDFELILVDDGSPDRCGEICDTLAQKDSRIHVIHQENQGLSMARNNGLLLAKGTYVLFLDSDDFYPQADFLQKLWENAGDKDVICFNYARYTDRLLPAMLAYPDGGTGDELWLELTKRNAYQSSACIKAVKRTLLLDYGICFEPGILSEDIEWNAKVMRHAKGVSLAPDCIYAYRVRPGSISKSVSKKHVEDQLRIIQRLADYKVERSPVFREAYNGYVSFQYSTLMINARICRPKLSREELRQVKKLAWLLQYDSNRIVKLIHTVYRVLGFDLTSWLLVVYFKLFCK